MVTEVEKENRGVGCSEPWAAGVLLPSPSLFTTEVRVSSCCRLWWWHTHFLRPYNLHHQQTTLAQRCNARIWGS